MAMKRWVVFYTSGTDEVEFLPADAFGWCINVDNGDHLAYAFAELSEPDDTTGLKGILTPCCVGCELPETYRIAAR